MRVNITFLNDMTPRVVDADSGEAVAVDMVNLSWSRDMGWIFTCNRLPEGIIPYRQVKSVSIDYEDEKVSAKMTVPRRDGEGVANISFKNPFPTTSDFPFSDKPCGILHAQETAYGSFPYHGFPEYKPISQSEKDETLAKSDSMGASVRLWADQTAISALPPTLPEKKRELRLHTTCSVYRDHQHDTESDAQLCFDKYYYHSALPENGWYSQLVSLCDQLSDGVDVFVSTDDQVVPVREACVRLNRPDLVVRVQHRV